MDERWITRLRTLAAAPLTRRGATGFALGAATAAMEHTLATPAGAKKKPPKTCAFRKSGKTWTLAKSCKTSKTIVVPGGVTVDGRNKTISAVGSVDKNFPDGVLRFRGNGGTVKNLKINGAGIRCPYTGPSVITFLAGDLSVSATTITGSCLAGIEAGLMNQPGSLQVTGLQVNGGVFGIRVNQSPMTVSIRNSTFQQAGLALTPASLIIDRVRITTPEGAGAIFSYVEGPITITNSTISGGVPGVTILHAATVTITGNTILGHPTTRNQPHYPFGIQIMEAASGTIDDNTIAGFQDSVSHDACGIDLAAAAAGVTVGSNNQFPNPPGNDHNVCTA